MDDFRYFDFRDDSQQLWDEILDTQKEAAQALAHALVAAAIQDENGCRVTETTSVRKVRFAGSQFPAYRFIYCALTETAASSTQVIRHRCHNRRCVNPDHLAIGSNRLLKKSNARQHGFERQEFRPELTESTSLRAGFGGSQGGFPSVCRPKILFQQPAKADNKRDDWEYWANGIDRDYLGAVIMQP